MKTKQRTERRRVRAHYSAADRDRLIEEQARSGKTQKAFCEERGIEPSSFQWWLKQRRAKGMSAPGFAEVETGAGLEAMGSVEVWLPNGARVVLRGPGVDVVALLRGAGSC